MAKSGHKVNAAGRVYSPLTRCPLLTQSGHKSLSKSWGGCLGAGRLGLSLSTTQVAARVAACAIMGVEIGSHSDLRNAKVKNMLTVSLVIATLAARFAALA